MSSGGSGWQQWPWQPGSWDARWHGDIGWQLFPGRDGSGHENKQQLQKNKSSSSCSRTPGPQPALKQASSSSRPGPLEPGEHPGPAVTVEGYVPGRTTSQETANDYRNLAFRGLVGQRIVEELRDSNYQRLSWAWAHWTLAVQCQTRKLSTREQVEQVLLQRSRDAAVPARYAPKCRRCGGIGQPSMDYPDMCVWCAERERNAQYWAQHHRSYGR